METKNKGSLMIKMNRNGDKTIMFNPVNGTVWLTKGELIQLFDVYQQTINACIDMILKAGVFNIEDVCKYNLIGNTTKNTIKYEAYEFNFEFIIAMAFRVRSENAEILRKWIINQVFTKEKLLQVPAIIQNYQWN
jgi:Virulence protein